MDNTLTTKTIQDTLDYFRPPQFYFWYWAEDGNVIESPDANDINNTYTLCYREDILPILRLLGTNGLPPFGALLLAIAACQENVDFYNSLATLRSEIQYSLSETESQSPLLKNLIPLLDGVDSFMWTIHELPKDLRTGENRKHLMHVIFEATSFKIPEQDARLILQELDSGRLDEVVFLKRDELITCQHFIADLKNLYEASRIFAEPGSLERKVRTGIGELPQPAELEITLEIFDQQKSRSLLEQLAEDPKTQPLSRLTKRLMATLTIPMHTQNSGEQPLGGVSDITNRGTIDKLLLSELAQDDLALMARLANNEALYMRREEVPNPQHRKRVLLLDTTLKMWGLPRIFSLSAALACTQQKKTNATFSAYALAGTEAHLIDLSTQAGILKTLEQLYPSLHCGAALAGFLQAQPKDPNTEYFFLTDEHTLHTPEFQAVFSSLKPLLHILITVSREGRLQVHECRENNQRLLTNLLVDINEILFAAPENLLLNSSIPAFLQQKSMPLYVPTPNNKLIGPSTYGNPTHGYICVTQTQMVLYWPYKTSGAIEVLNYIEDGTYCVGHDPVSTQIYVTVHNPSKSILKLYQLTLATGEKQVFEYASMALFVSDIRFRAGSFYVRTQAGLLSVNPGDGTYTDRTSTMDRPLMKQNEFEINFKDIKKHLNSGYTTLTKANRMYITPDNKLAIDTRQLFLHHSSMLIFEESSSQADKARIATKTEGITFAGIVNPQHRFMKFTWANGSEAILDSRGFLYLRSSDKSIPEITLLYITNATTAAWTSDGNVCGNAYFIQDKQKIMQTLEFYDTYIQRFIDNLSKP